ncbi:MAG: hypothetical protein IJ542_00350 [Clostridia bacterium]|nr:hypothetical protein [Clostridia bacterium]
MAEEIRDLEVSQLCAEDFQNISIDKLRRIKPITSKLFDSLPQEIQKKFSTLFDDAVTIWNNPEKIRKLSNAEVVALLEPYKKRSWKTFPKILKEKLLNLYREDVSAKSRQTKLLLWFLDKREFAPEELPEEVNAFLNQAYSEPCKAYDIESFRTLVGGIRKLPYNFLSDNQKEFLRNAFSYNVDSMPNEFLYILVNYVKNAKMLNIDFRNMPHFMQEFIFECYKRCVVKTETSAHNKKMVSGWYKTNEDQYRCFAAFNRAFVRLKTFDRAMYFDNPAKKLTLPNLIRYANLQAKYIGKGSINNFYEDVFSRTNSLAVELGLPALYTIIDQAYHFNPDAILGYDILKESDIQLEPPEGAILYDTIDSFGRPRRWFKVETTREYKERIATPLAKAFDDMIHYYSTIATKNTLSETISKEEQVEAINYILSLFGKDITIEAHNFLETKPSIYDLKKDAYVNILENALKDLMNVDAMKEILANRTAKKIKEFNDLEEYLSGLSDEELAEWRKKPHSKKEINAYNALFGKTDDVYYGYSQSSAPNYGYKRINVEYDPYDINTWEESHIKNRIADIQIAMMGKLDAKEKERLTMELQELQWLLSSDKFYTEPEND